MKIDVRVRGVEGAFELRQHVLRRVQFQLDRFGEDVTGVVVRLEDMNGPRGGVDKRCSVTVRGPALGTLTVEDVNANIYAVVDASLDRLGRAVTREIVRRRETPSVRSLRAV